MKITTHAIIQNINTNFAKTYRTSSSFVNSGQLWDFCISVLSDPVLTKCIIFSNDVGVPPIKSILHLYNLKFSPPNNFSFSAQQSQWLGSLMAFTFKNVFNYKSQKERIQVNFLGIGTATKFLDGPSDIEIK